MGSVNGITVRYKISIHTRTHAQKKVLNEHNLSLTDLAYNIIYFYLISNPISSFIIFFRCCCYCSLVFYDYCSSTQVLRVCSHDYDAICLHIHTGIYLA